MRPRPGFGMFGPRRPRDPERSRKIAKILLIAGVVLALGTVIQFVIVSRSGTPSPKTHACAVPAGATRGAEPPPGNVPKLVEPLGTPDVTFTRKQGSQTAYVYCYDQVSEDQAQGAISYLTELGYERDSGDTHQVNFTSDSAVPYGISLFATEGLDLEHAGTGSGGLAVTWVDEKPE